MLAVAKYFLKVADEQGRLAKGRPVCKADIHFFSRITQKLQNRYPQNLDGGCFLDQNRPH